MRKRAASCRYATWTTSCACDYKYDGKCYSCKGSGIVKHRESIYLCVGGPCNGLYRNKSSLVDEYEPYNSAHGYANLPSHIWIYVPLIKRKT